MRSLLLILTICLFSCCNPFKQVTTENEHRQVEEETVTEFKDSSTITTTEMIDTTVKITPDSLNLEFEVPFSETANSDTPVPPKIYEYEDDHYWAKFIFDLEHDEFSADIRPKPQEIPVKKQKKTTTQNNKTSKQTKDITTKEKKKTKTKEPTFNWMPVIITGVTLAFIVFLIIIILIIKKFK